MFKYVWIIMLVIAAVIFIGYTIYTIYDSYQESIWLATQTGKKDYDAEWLLSETISNLWYIHSVLCGVWIVIFLSTIGATFLFSLMEYVGSIGFGG